MAGCFEVWGIDCVSLAQPLKAFVSSLCVGRPDSLDPRLNGGACLKLFHNTESELTRLRTAEPPSTRRCRVLLLRRMTACEHRSHLPREFLVTNPSCLRTFKSPPQSSWTCPGRRRCLGCGFGEGFFSVPQLWPTLWACLSGTPCLPLLGLPESFGIRSSVPVVHSTNVGVGGDVVGPAVQY